MPKKNRFLKLILLLCILFLSSCTSSIGGKQDPLKVSSEVKDGKVTLSWEALKDKNVKGYKVVISKNNPNPSYPKDGYLTYITDRSKESITIDNKISYSDGDFGEFLKPGEKYYLSITTVYKDSLISSNAVEIIYPEEGNKGYASGKKENPSEIYEDKLLPKLKAEAKDKTIVLSWNRIDDPKFFGYKIVISKNNQNPVYPADGDLAYIQNPYKTSYVIDGKKNYNGGDFGGVLKSGEYYYISITAVFKDKNVPGNVIRIKFPE